jgi:hypothetical protein
MNCSAPKHVRRKQKENRNNAASQGDLRKRGSMSKPNVQSDRPYDVMIDKEIAMLAYRYWEQRGRPIGSPEVDWYRAEGAVNREQSCHGLGLGLMRFSKFHIGDVVHNHETNEDGKIVGFRDTAGIPEYEVIVTVEPNNWELGCSLTLWPENTLETSISEQ